jgi:glutamate carboxypeptidase
VRADRLEAFDAVVDAIPAEHVGAALRPEIIRRWPGMDSEAATAPVLESASALLGRPIVAAGRGGASDASHFAAQIPCTIDGLGPRGGGAHAPDEHVLEASIQPRAQVALAIVHSLLHDGEHGGHSRRHIELPM